MGKEDIKNNRDRETVDVSESFNFTKETNNDPMTNEFFVYHYEENKKQLGGEENKKDIGKEVNDDVDKAQEVKIEDISKVTKVTNAASTAVHTAVVATTTVVVVVAGGAAVTELSYAKPNVHEFSAIEVVGNAFTYTLRIGDSDDSIDNGLENKSCNVVVELKLDSYKETVNVNKYGSFTGTFENLRYDTEYTLTAYEYSTLDIGGLMPHLLVTTQVRTKPESHNNVTFNRVIDSYQQEHYYVTLTYDDDNNYYSSFAIDVVSLDDGSIVSSSNLREPYTDKQEIIMGQDFDGQGKYRIDVTCLSTNPDDQPQGLRGEGEAQQEIRITLFSQEVDFSAIESSEDPITNNIFFYKTQRQNGEMRVEAMLTSPYEDMQYYSNFNLSLEWQPAGSADPDSRETSLETIYREKQVLSEGLDMNLEDWTYEMHVVVTCISTNPEDLQSGGNATGRVEIEFVNTTIDFNEIPTEDEEYVEPVFNGIEVTRCKTYYDNYNGFLLSVDAYDPCEFWNTYEFQLYSDAQHEEEIGYPMTVFDTSEVIRLDSLNDPDDPYTNLADDPSTYYYTVTSYSSDPNSQETEITHISDGEICFATLTPTLTDVCPYVIYTKTALEDTGSGYPYYSMEAELVYANKEQYTNYKLTFSNGSGDERSFEFYNDYTCDFNGTNDIDAYLWGTYTATLTAEEAWGGTVILSVETLEFDHTATITKG